MSGEAAWRLLTGARYDASQVQLSGDMTLAEPLLSVRGIIVLAGQFVGVGPGAYAGPGPRGWGCPAAQGSAGHRADTNQPVPTQRNDTDTHADQGGTST